MSFQVEASNLSKGYYPGISTLDSASSKRITYFDTTKGLLMLLLIWGHMIIFARSLNIQNGFTPFIQNTVPFYRAFFMQTFFVITGYCTSWNTPFSEFFKKNFKTIVFPAFAFIPFMWMSRIIVNGWAGLSGLINIISQYILDGIPWFLSALFISKILYWGIIRVFSHSPFRKTFHTITLSGIFLIGLTSSYYGLPNIWYYQQSFVMLPFLFIGDYVCKINKRGVNTKFISVRRGELMNPKNLWLLSIPYFILIILWQMLGLKLGFPAVDAFIDINYKTAVFYIGFAISGTALILALSQYLQSIKWINIIGRQSLFVYLIHSFIVLGLMRLFTLDNNEFNFIQGAVFYLSIYLLSLLLIYAGCKIWESKYLKFMLGRF